LLPVNLGTTGIVVLFLIGVTAIIIEMFIPGIVLGVAGFGMCVLSIVIAFQNNPTLGWVLAITGIIMAPILVVAWFKVVSGYFAVKSTEEGFTASVEEDKDLLGAQGVAVTNLRPAGMARINDRRVNVMADGQMIPVNTRIEVIKVEGNRVVVRPVKIK